MARAKKADSLMLTGKNLRTKRRIEKLHQKRLRQFIHLHKICSRAYEIEQPDRREIYPIFYIGLLEPYQEHPNRRPQKEIPIYNDLTIGCYNDYHLSPNDIPSGSQTWYGLIHLVSKWLVNIEQGLGDSGVALGTL